jgi:membrane-bound inhibitor of C-type lysozyme
MPRATLVVLAVAALLAGCGGGTTKEEIPSPDTFECAIEGERWLVRFVEGEARLLAPDGSRTNLYQIAAASGVRYTNGMIELRGKGLDLALVADGVARRLVGCKPLMIPKENPGPLERIWQQPPSSPLGK